MKKTILIIFYFLISLSVKSQSSIDYILKADSLFDREKYSSAIDNYDKAIELDSMNAELYLKRGKCHVKKNSAKKAINDYTHAININPNYSEAYIRRGNLYKILGNMEAYNRDMQDSEGLGNSDVYKDSYKASNGINYKVGDTIKLGKGANPNGSFRWLQVGGWGAILMATSSSNYKDDDRNIGKSYAGLNVILKKIHRYKFKGATTIVFSVGGGNITNYDLNIEQAIDDCEVVPCKSNQQNNIQVVNEISVADEILKLKKLLDDNIITQSEFDKQKEKLLNK